MEKAYHPPVLSNDFDRWLFSDSSTQPVANDDGTPLVRNGQQVWLKVEPEQRLAEVRELARQHGLRLMHRRNGQYWLVRSEPMSLNEIEAHIHGFTVQHPEGYDPSGWKWEGDPIPQQN